MSKFLEEPDHPPVALCDNCVSGATLPGDPQGSMISLGGLDCYVTAGAGNGEKAIVIAADAFGLGIPNPRIVADRLSLATGLQVFVPDLLKGDYPSFDKLYKVDSPLGKLPLFTRVTTFLKLVGSTLAVFGPTFFIRHRMAVLVPLMRDFCVTLKREKALAHLGLVGFCLGGQVSTILAGDISESSKTPLIEVFVVAHPGPLRVADFAKVRYPLALVCAEEDVYFHGDLKAGAVRALETLKDGDGAPIPVAIYEHPGTTHGFAARPDIREPVVAEQFDKAQVEIADWFKQHL